MAAASASPERPKRSGGTIALGIAVIVVAALWLLFWGFVALLALALGGDPAGWILVMATVVTGILALVLGISLVRGRAPGKVGWIVTGVAILLVVAIPLGELEQAQEAKPVNRAVETAYVMRHHVRSADADCSSDDAENPDGSEAWTCEIVSEVDYDFCLVAITRTEGHTAARKLDCTSDDEAP